MVYCAMCFVVSSIKTNCDLRILIMVGYFIACFALILAWNLSFGYLSIIFTGLSLIGIGLAIVVIWSLQFIQKFLES